MFLNKDEGVLKEIFLNDLSMLLKEYNILLPSKVESIKIIKNIATTILGDTNFEYIDTMSRN